MMTKPYEMNLVAPIYDSEGTFKTTILDFCRVTGIPVPTHIDSSYVIPRVMTQPEYSKPDDVVIINTILSNEEAQLTKALEKNVYAIVCSPEHANHFIEKDPSIESKFICADNPMEVFRRYASWRRSICKAKLLTITGSVGKSTTTGLVTSIVTDYYNTLSSYTMNYQANLNSQGSALRFLQRLSINHDVWVQELGADGPKYIEGSAIAFRPNAVIITNIGVAHIDRYKSREGILYDKCSLERELDPSGVVIINKDDELLRYADYSHEVITVGVKSEDVDYRAENIRVTDEGTDFDLVCDEGRYPVHINVIGEHNAYNAAAALALAVWMGIDIENAIKSITNYQTIGFRQNLTNVGGYTMLLDCHNASPESVIGTAKTLSFISRPERGHKIFITGHVDLLGDESVTLHEQIGRELIKTPDIDEFIFFTGDSIHAYNAALEEGARNVRFFNNREALNQWITENITRKDIVAYKTSQLTANLVITIDHIYGTSLGTGLEHNEGLMKEYGDYEIRVRRFTTELAGYKGKDMELVLPSEYEGVEIFRIAYGALRGKDIKTVRIPNSIKNIGNSAFYRCRKLENVVLPISLKYIERSAFNTCTSLKKVVIPEGTIHIDKFAFRDCKKLRTINIPESVGYIADDAFFNCEDKITIVCPRNSYAEEYAKTHSIKYRNEGKGILSVIAAIFNS